MSKRKLLELVEAKVVSGWADPRLPTIAGYKRRGYTKESILNFCNQIGIAKANSMVDVAQLEFCIRDDLNKKVPRVMCVLDSLKVTIENMKKLMLHIILMMYQKRVHELYLFLKRFILKEMILEKSLQKISTV